MHSEFYNLFEREVTVLFKSIKDMGHKLGLHFDYSYYNANNAIDLENIYYLKSKYLKIFLR